MPCNGFQGNDLNQAQSHLMAEAPAAAPDQPMQFPLLISILLLPHSETGVKATGQIPSSKTPGLTSWEMVCDS